MTFKLIRCKVAPMTYEEFSRTCEIKVKEATVNIPSSHNRKMTEAAARARCNVLMDISSSLMPVEIAGSEFYDCIVVRIGKDNLGTKKWVWIVENVQFEKLWMYSADNIHFKTYKDFEECVLFRREAKE